VAAAPRLTLARRGTVVAMGEIIVLLIIGLIVGALGRFVNPGRDPMPIWMTLLIGVAAVLIVGLLIEGILGYILAVIVAAVLVTLVQRLFGGRERGATA